MDESKIVSDDDGVHAWSGLPEIDQNDKLNVVARRAWNALTLANDTEKPEVMVRGGHLVEPNGATLRPWGADWLRHRLDETADFYVETRGGKRIQSPKMDVTKTILDAPASYYSGVPVVDRIVDVPVAGSDRKIVARAGYHPADRVYYEPSDALVQDDALRSFLAWPDSPTFDDVIHARDFILNEVLIDFSFADDASRANALGLMILPFVRNVIGDAPTPLHIVQAVTPGAGKTLLAQAMLAPACGHVSVMADVRSGDEFRKRLTAALLASQPAIIIDNVNARIEGAELAAALTAGVWSDRILGKSEIVEMPIRAAWVATGNNLSMSSEITRRSVLIELDVGSDPPSRRAVSRFKHPDLLDWTLTNRPRLVEAALTLVRHWLDGDARLRADGEFERQEHMTRPAQTLGSFNKWADVVGGVLAACDVPGFLGNLDRRDEEVDDEVPEITAFLSAWRQVYDDQSISSETLALECANPMSPLYEAVPTSIVAKRGAHDFIAALRWWLRSNRDRHFGSFVIHGKRPTSRNVNVWCVDTR